MTDKMASQAAVSCQITYSYRPTQGGHICWGVKEKSSQGTVRHTESHVRTCLRWFFFLRRATLTTATLNSSPGHDEMLIFHGKKRTSN